MMRHVLVMMSWLAPVEVLDGVNGGGQLQCEGNCLQPHVTVQLLTKGTVTGSALLELLSCKSNPS